ncbi:class II fructose-bisphosphate aldolase [Candidatus Woesearchaeota archaeon]|nr:class II fructose-bisphosphate aldolase [Candidatus Woesearchaeota archaeon]
MKLYTNIELQSKAQKKGYSVGAFNFANLETLQAILNGAKELNAPVIVQTSESAITYAGLKNIVALVQVAIKEHKQPISLHLDHGKTNRNVSKVLKAGYSSIMLDGSKYSFKKNVMLTKKAAQLAHKNNASCEGELGILAGVEDENIKSEKHFFTDPSQAKEFVKLTNIDTLAPAIGNAHGFYKGRPKLNFQILKELQQTINVPLVLHGASGIPANDIKKAVKLGITKINIDTELQLAATLAEKQYFKEHPLNKMDKKTFDPRKYLSVACDAVKEKVKEKIELFGSAEKA